MMPLPNARRSRLRCEALEDRLTPASAGDLDPTFNGTGIKTPVLESNVNISAEAIAPDGKIVVIGSTLEPAPGGIALVIARFLPNGQLDSSFHGNGQLVSNISGGGFSNVAVQSDGSILIDISDIHVLPLIGSGFTAGPAGELIQISADGNTVTDKFAGGADGIAINPSTGDVYLADTPNATPIPGSSGPIVLPPPPTSPPPPPQVRVTRLDKDLHLLGSTMLDISSSFSGAVRGIALDSASQVYVLSRSGLTRLDADLNKASAKTVNFTLDSGGSISGLAINSAGQVFVSENIVRPSGGSVDSAVWRLDSDLNKQAQTTLSNFTDSGVLTDPVGRVVVVGDTNSSQSPNTDTDFVIARLNPTDLSLDTSFNKTGMRTLDISQRDYPLSAGIDQNGNIVVLGENTLTSTRVIFRLLGLDKTPTGPVLAGGSLDGSATPLTATNGTYQAGTSVAFFPGFVGDVRTASADVNDDGVPDYIGGSGPGGGPRVAIIDGKTGARLADFFAFESSFTGGVYVTAADINGDGKADVIVTPDQGGGAVVAVFDGAKLAAGQTADAAQITRFLGIDDAAFRGGARPALADVNGDGQPDLLVSAGFQGGPRIALFDGKTIAASGTPVKLVPDFFAFEDSLRNGAFVTAGDLTGDGQADLFFGAGPGGAPRVRAFDAAKLLAAGSLSNLDTIASTAQMANFFAGDPSSRGGVRLATRDSDGDGKADLIAGSGEGEPAQVRVYKGTTLLASATPTADQTLDPFNGATLANGVFVG